LELLAISRVVNPESNLIPANSGGAQMLRRFYAICALVTALGVGLVVASAAPGQKEKEKDKEKEKAESKLKDKTWVVSGEMPQVFTLSGFSDRGYLGVFLEEVTPERAKEMGLSEERGAIIMKVVKDSPAEKAGLKENDVVVSYNGRRIDTMSEFQRLLSETPADRTVTIEVIRGGSRQNLTATLSKRSGAMSFYQPELSEKFWKDNQEAMRKAQESLKQQQELFNKMPRDFGSYSFVAPREWALFRGRRLGIGVESLTSQLGEFFGVQDGKGVLVTEVEENSAAAKGGLKAGDVITAIDNLKVDNVGTLLEALAKKEEGAVAIKVIRNRSEQTINVTLEKPAQPAFPRTPRARVSTGFSRAL
jgi:serine protease Do